MASKFLIFTVAASSVFVLSGCGSRGFGDVTSKVSQPLLAQAAHADISPGERHLIARRYGLAVHYFTQVLARAPADLDALKGAAVAYDKLGRFDLSSKYYQRALKLDPGSAVVLNNLGYSLILQDKPDDAVPYLQAAKAADDAVPERTSPSPAEANLRLAMLAAEAKEKPKMATVAPEINPLIARETMRLRHLVTDVSAEFMQTAKAAQIKPALIIPARSRMIRAPVIRLSTRSRAVRYRQFSSAVSTQNAAKSGSASRPAAYRLEVSNGAGINGMAYRMRSYLDRTPASAALTNADHFGFATTVISYRGAFRQAAERLAAALPFQVTLDRDDSLRRDVRLRLGADAISFDGRMRNIETERI